MGKTFAKRKALSEVYNENSILNDTIADKPLDCSLIFTDSKCRYFSPLPEQNIHTAFLMIVNDKVVVITNGSMYWKEVIGEMPEGCWIILLLIYSLGLLFELWHSLPGSCS